MLPKPRHQRARSVVTDASPVLSPPGSHLPCQTLSNVKLLPFSPNCQTFFSLILHHPSPLLSPRMPRLSFSWCWALSLLEARFLEPSWFPLLDFTISQLPVLLFLSGNALAQDECYPFVYYCGWLTEAGAYFVIFMRNKLALNFSSSDVHITFLVIFCAIISHVFFSVLK